MIRLVYLKINKYLVKILHLKAYRSFQWSDYIFPSSLQLSSQIDLMLSHLKEVELSKKLELGLHEALVNAVRHGNLEDPMKKLRVRRILTPKWVVWQIQDDGVGLPLDKRVTILPEEVDSESGRGLFIISQCFDDIRWSSKGNMLQLASRRTHLRT